MLGDEFNSFFVAVRSVTQQQLDARAVAAGLGKRGNHSKGRQAREGLDVVGTLHGIVHVLAEERQADPADQTDEESQRDVSSLRRTRGIGGHHGRIHHANIGRAQAGGDAGLFEFCQEPVVQRFVAFRFALENAVLHHALGHLIYFGLLLIESLGEQLFALANFAILALQTRDDAFLFLLGGGIEFLELRLQPLHLGEVGAILIQGVGILGIGVGAFAQKILDDAVVANLGNGVHVAGFGVLVKGLLAHAFALRFGQLPVEVAEALGSNVLLVAIESPNLVLAFIGDARIFGFFDANLQLV